MNRNISYVIGYKLSKKGEHTGLVRALFERIGGRLEPINMKAMFCETKQVFIVADYELIDEKYTDGELFSLDNITENAKWNESFSPCRYVSYGNVANKLGAKEIVEVIETKLPSPTNRKINSFKYRPITKYIFIKNESFLYGPFEYEIEENLVGGFYLTLHTLAITLFNKTVPNGYICKIEISDDIVTETFASGYDRQFVLNIEDFNDQNVESFDYRNDDVIIQDGNKLLKSIGNEFSKNEIKALKENVLKIPDLTQLDRNTIDRFFPLFEKMEQWDSIASQMIQNYFESDFGKNYLRSYLNENKEKYFEDIENEQVHKLESDKIKTLKTEIDELEKAKLDLKSAIDELADDFRTEKNKLANVKPDESLASISAEYKQKENELLAIQSKIDFLKNEYSNLASIVDLENEISYLKRLQEDHRKETINLEDAHRKLKSQVAGDEDDIKKKLLEYKTYIDVIYTARNDSKLLKDYSIAICKSEKQNKSKAQKEYIEHIHNFLLANGRNYTKAEIVNLVVSIQQSFITVLAGLPGVGKTSLIQLLGKSLGLADRLLNISVARGWTSQRDLLGYFNPLNNSFQAAATGFYDLLNATSKENPEKPQAPIYVLLDEANLSPIEHYWSNFMIMTDDKNSRLIQTGKYGEDSEMKISDALRFIATINYDNTTETLSPRLIDRAPIIKLRPENVISENIKHYNELNQEFLAYSNQDLSNLFDVLDKEKFGLEDKESEILDDIIQILQHENPDFGQPIVVSQRKQLAIAKYCHVARDNMIEEGKLKALDYAISQHILPLINGSGEKYKNRLKELQNRIPKSDFKISHSQLDRIIKIGENEVDTFNFFV